jgi:hypothetical protein
MMQRILILPDIWLIQKPDTEYSVRPDFGFPLVRPDIGYLVRPDIGYSA